MSATNIHDHGFGIMGSRGSIIANKLASLADGAVSANFFSSLLGLNAATVSQMLQNKKQISDDIMTMMLSTLKDLAILIEKTKPLRIDFKPVFATEYRTILRKIREGDLFINIYDLKGETVEARERQRMELRAALDALGTPPQGLEPPAEAVVAQPVEPKAQPVHRPLVKNFG